jgi:energy-coupling factor transporter transmembrane protein EcfT
MESEILILDEPLAGLDGIHQKKILDLIERLRSAGKTVIVSTHSMEDAAAFDLVGVMAGGTMAAFAPAREIFGARWDPAWGLSLPWTADVSRRLCEAGILPEGAAALNAEELVRCLREGVPKTGLQSQKQDYSPKNRNPVLKTGPQPEQNVKRNRRRKTGIEFFRNVAIGQFLGRPSPLRNMRGGIKLLLLLALAVAAVALPPARGIFVTMPLLKAAFPAALLALTLLSGGLLGKVGPKHLLRSLLPIAPWIIIIMAIQIAYSGINEAGIVRAAALLFRLAALVALLSLYSAVTPFRETVAAVNAFFGLLKPAGFPSREASLAVGIAFRFVPILSEEAERIVTAQLSRGGRKNRFSMAFSMIIPLILRALERSEKLAKAMALRRYA